MSDYALWTASALFSLCMLFLTVTSAEDVTHLYGTYVDEYPQSTTEIVVKTAASSMQCAHFCVRKGTCNVLMHSAISHNEVECQLGQAENFQLRSNYRAELTNRHVQSVRPISIESEMIEDNTFNSSTVTSSETTPAAPAATEESATAPAATEESATAPEVTTAAANYSESVAPTATTTATTITTTTTESIQTTEVTVFTNCTAALADHDSGEGSFGISLDGMVFQIYCVRNGSQSFAIFHHDGMEREMYHYPSPYKRAFTYSTPLPDIDSIKSFCGACQQKLKYECLDSQLSDKNAFWKDMRGGKHGYFPSLILQGSGNGECYCSGTEDCCCDKKNDDTNCVCDNGSSSLLEDEGYFTMKDVLPVTELVFDDVSQGNKYGYHTLGPLMCLF